MFCAAYALLLDLEVCDEEVHKAIERVNTSLERATRARETGQPDLPDWVVPADAFMPRGR